MQHQITRHRAATDMRTSYLKTTGIILGVINVAISIAMGALISSGSNSEGYIKSRIDLYHDVGIFKSIFLLFFPSTGLLGGVFLVLALILNEFGLFSQLFYALSVAMFIATAFIVLAIFTSSFS